MLSRALSRDNRLYLTLDFNAQILCIHRSQPVPFKDILEVEPLLARRRQASQDCTLLRTGSCEIANEDMCECSASRSSRKLARSSFSLSWGQKQDGFTLRVRGCKKMCLYCSSAEESAQWIAALRQAICEADVANAEMWTLPSPTRKRTVGEIHSSSTPRLLGRRPGSPTSKLALRQPVPAICEGASTPPQLPGATRSVLGIRCEDQGETLEDL